MDIKVRKADPLKTKTACLVLGACEKPANDPLWKELDTKLDGQLRSVVRSSEFAGKSGETLMLRTTGAIPAERLLLIGLGKRQDLSLERLRQAAGRSVQAIKGKRFSTIAFALPLLQVARSEEADRVQAVVEGLRLAGYQFDRYLGEDARKQNTLPGNATLLVDSSGDLNPARSALDRTEKLCRAVYLARDLVNEPGNTKSPAWLAEQAKQAATASGLACTILESDALTKEGFGAMLGVAQGSDRGPRLIVLEHHGGKKKEAPVALVGKGVVFDTGGISLKPAEKMDEMKMDMAGGAAVIGAMMAAALLELPLNLVGVVPAVENMPSGTAIRPGDILTSLSGQTIEVLNTDAEGRLILADALTYVKRYDPRLVVDLATLTGACIIALGHHASAVLGNDDRLIQHLVDAGETSGERLWQLPLWSDYDQQIKSHVADVKNIGGRPAGTITAAAFLKKFAKDAAWAHLDIAGTAWCDREHPYLPKGGTGVGVRLLTSFLEKLPTR